jgi:hypothetical protein
MMHGDDDDGVTGSTMTDGMNNNESLPTTIRTPLYDCNDSGSGNGSTMFLLHQSTGQYNRSNERQKNRLFRWYHQLTLIQAPVKDGYGPSLTSCHWASMIAVTSLHYEQLQNEYHNFFDLLVMDEPCDDDDVTTAPKAATAAAAAASSSSSLSEMNSTQERLLAIDKTQASNISTASTTPVSESLQSFLDPLSAFVQEEEERANRERRIHECYQRAKKSIPSHSQYKNTYVPDEPQDPNDPSYTMANATAYVQLILKDLHRLPSPHTNAVTTATSDVTTATVTSSSSSSSSATSVTPVRGRMRQLQSILYLFAISHPQAGYIQGMHEIASYCLYAVEIEMDVPMISTESTTCTPNSTTSPMEALAYWFTEQILTSLFTAYDITSTVNTTTATQPIGTTGSTSSHTNPLTQMSNRILHCLLLTDPELYTVVQPSLLSASIPFQLIFTKWIRLLFGREVIATAPESSSTSNDTAAPRTHHADIVIYLWDVLLEASYRLSIKQQEQQQQQTNATTGSTASTILSPLQVVAECFCAARLWHYKYTILHLQQHSSTNNNNYLLHWFMNIPPESIHELQSIILRMNYIIDRQWDSHNTGTHCLPPFHPISAEIYAMTQHQSYSPSVSHTGNVHSLQPSSTTRFQPMWDSDTYSITGGSPSFLQTAAAAFANVTSSASLSDAPAPSLSALAETITAKTQSIQKLITKEWEQVRAHLQQDNEPQQQSYGAIGSNHNSLNQPSAMSPPQSNLYNLDYYSTGR